MALSYPIWLEYQISQVGHINHFGIVAGFSLAWPSTKLHSAHLGMGEIWPWHVNLIICWEDASNDWFMCEVSGTNTRCWLSGSINVEVCAVGELSAIHVFDLPYLWVQAILYLLGGVTYFVHKVIEMFWYSLDFHPQHPWYSAVHLTIGRVQMTISSPKNQGYWPPYSDTFSCSCLRNHRLWCALSLWLQSCSARLCMSLAKFVISTDSFFWLCFSAFSKF